MGPPARAGTSMLICWLVCAALCVAAQGSGNIVTDCSDCISRSPVNSSSPEGPVESAQSASDGPRLIPSLAAHLAQSQAELTATHRKLTKTQGGASKPQHGDHQPLFPVSGLEVAVLVVAGVVLFIAAGAGMGGGPVLVPLYLLAGLSNTAAVALSNSTILAGSVGNTAVNIFKRHPYKNKPMIDWDLVLLMEPPTLIGAIAGSYINKLLPAWITSVLLVLLLALMTVRVAQRAARIYKRETAARREESAGQPAAATGAPTQPSSSLPPAPTHSRTSDWQAGRRAVPAGQTSSSGAAAAAAAGSAAATADGSIGVVQLLAEQRATQVGPSDQPAPLYNSSSGTSCDSKAAAGSRSVLQSPPNKTPPPKHRPAVSAGASPFSQTPSERPASPSGGAESAPAATGGRSTLLAAGHLSPYRGTLSTVPSSVLLNLELEGNISEAALQRLAMHEQGAAAGWGAGGAASHADPADASLASMDGVGSSHGWWWWQQQPRQRQQQQRAAAAAALRARLEQQQQLQEEPPSEAECRLLYAPPDHTRRDSWELAWEGDDDQHAAAQSAGLGGSLVHHGSTPPAAAALGLGSTLSPDRAEGRAGHGPDATAAPGTAAGRPRLLPAQGAAPTAAAGSAGPRSATAAGAGMVQMASAQHQLVPAAAVASALGSGPNQAAAVGGTSAHGQSGSVQQQGGSRCGAAGAQAQAPEVAAACRADAVARMLAMESAQVPLVPALLLLLMFLAVLLSSLFSKMLPCGSAGYWAVQWSVAPALLAVWWFSRRRVLAKVALKKEAQLDFHGEVRWTPRKSLVFPAICSIAGIIAGMFGLGGAVVKTPLMLELGVHPSVTAATTQTMLLLTSSASSIVYAQLGDTPWDWASVMLPMAFAATLAGQAAIDWLVKKVGRSSMVVLVLAAFFIVATCLSIYTLAGAAKAVAADPQLLGRLGRICR